MQCCFPLHLSGTLASHRWVAKPLDATTQLCCLAHELRTHTQKLQPTKTTPVLTGDPASQVTISYVLPHTSLHLPKHRAIVQ